ncbi:hypothetical protein [Halorarius halobius]|uniref:hypothetical protein n=1 Tax=Halorarius halobius TaxID=2962671 RepID=UPI0020CCD2CC|nr:hypothetical protein [Halorarius halobius]
MSMAIAHFAFGGAVTVLVVTYLLPGLPYPRAAALAGGVWAMLPDAHWVSPVAAADLKALHASRLVDVFFLHHSLDTLDPTDSKRVAAALVALFFLVTLVAERREYRALERVRELSRE